MATANAHFVNGRWDDADYHYGLLRTEYPKSEHQFQAHLLGLRCKLLRYQGARLRRLAARRSRRTGHAIADAVPARAGRGARARRAGAGRHRAPARPARMGHGRVLRQGQVLRRLATLSTTRSSRSIPKPNWRKQSRGRLEQIRSEPDNPTPPFEWLVNIVPGIEARRPRAAQERRPWRPSQTTRCVAEMPAIACMREQLRMTPRISCRSSDHRASPRRSRRNRARSGFWLAAVAMVGWRLRGLSLRRGVALSARHPDGLRADVRVEQLPPQPERAADRRWSARRSSSKRPTRSSARPRPTAC